MAQARLSRPQRHVLAWLWAHEERFKGTLRRSLANLEAKGLATITRSPGRKAKAVDLTPAGRQMIEPLLGSGE
jgi:DNA-binding MarR family transcriptional regulator